MGATERKLTCSNGFTMIEVLLSVLIVLFTSTAYLMWQKTSWSQTTLANRRMRACQIMEKQIEGRRMTIAQNPAVNFAAFKALTSETITETSVTPNITVVWTVFDTLHAPNGDPVTGAVRVHLVARWGPGTSDSLSLWTNVTENF
jgi:prepilin-type N-terminal cleavage/methylation domain-containing protein